MLRMCYDIQIGDYHLKGIESVKVESSIDLLADQCTIVLPGSAYNKAYQLEDKVKRGDAVLVRLGYNDSLKDEFKGYLKSIHPNNPMKLECEDSIYLFRKPIKDKHFKKTTATVIARYIIDQINAQLPASQKMLLVTDLTGFQFDKFTIVNATGFQALQTLKEQTGGSIYCRGRNLHFHLAYTEKRGQVTYDFAKNIEESDDLEYVKAEDVRTRIKVIGQWKKGEKIEVEVGEEGGNQITLKRPNITDKASLTKLANQELKRVCYDGYKGAIKGWLTPFCGIGYSATIIDADYKERAGSYFVNAVKTEFSREGGRRTVTLGIKVSASQANTTPLSTSITPLPKDNIAKSFSAAETAPVDDPGDKEDNSEGSWA